MDMHNCDVQAVEDRPRLECGMWNVDEDVDVARDERAFRCVGPFWE